MNGALYGVLFFVLAYVCSVLFLIPVDEKWEISSIMGMAAMVTSGLIYRRFTVPVKKLEQITVSLPEGEILLLQAPANVQTEDGAVPGKLFLTGNRLLFKPVDGQEVFSWPLSSLHAVGFYRSIQNAGGEFVLATPESNIAFEVDWLRPWKEQLRLPQANK